MSRRFDAGARQFTLSHTGADGLVDAGVELTEVDGEASPRPRTEIRAALATHAARG